MSLPTSGSTGGTGATGAAVPPQTKDQSTVSSKDPWEEAFDTLDIETQSQFKKDDTNLLGILRQIQTSTEENKALCLEKGWKAYRNKKGEDVKLRHVLEKISAWVTEIISIVEVPVSFDPSSHAALPWAVIKFLVTVGTNDVAVFSNMSESIESVSRLIARYTIFEKLYLREADCESGPQLHEALRELYAAILRYLANSKRYFSGNSISASYQDIKINPRILTIFSRKIRSKPSKYLEVQRKMAKDSVASYETLRAMLHKLDRPIMQLADSLSVIQDRFKSEERKEVFLWMSEIEYREHHQDLSKDVLPNSGQWLLKGREYIEWGQSSVSSILWLHGIPGSGKTKLVSTVINDVFEAHSNMIAPPIAFFYCVRNDAERERALPVEILRAILRQLSSTQPDQPIKEPVATEYESRKKKGDEDCSKIRKLTVEDCTRLILALTNHSPATIIIDALDECDEFLRHELLEALDEIVSKSSQVVKVFVSSRDDVDIELRLRQSKNISISADKNGQDIERFIESEIDKLIARKLLLDGKVSPRLRGKMTKVLNKGAQGMFQWVALSLDVLRRIKFKPDFEKALGQLPESLSALYDTIHARIEKTETNGRRVAVATLSWLLCAQRLLSTRELVAAVSLDVEVDDETPPVSYNTDLDPDDELSDAESEGEPGSVSITDIIRLCHNLVIVDSELDVFRFSHQSVREYLQYRNDYIAAELHALAVERCLHVYLVGGVMSRSPAISTVVSWGDLLKSYARLYWPAHYQAAEEIMSAMLKERILPFFVEEKRTSLAYTTWAREINSEYADRSDIFRALDSKRRDRLGHRIWSAALRPPSPFRAACAFGLFSLLEELDKVSQDSLNQLALSGDKLHLLHIAAKEGHGQIVERLLGEGFDPDTRNEYDETPLLSAAKEGREVITKVLVNNGSNLEASDEVGTPLIWAVVRGDEAAVKILLEKGANFEASGAFDMTPLMSAAQQGNEAIVKMLLEKGANLEALGANGRTPLTYAAELGNDTAVRMRLVNGADLESPAEVQGWPALLLVPHPVDVGLEWRGHKEVVMMLLRKGVIRDSKNEDYDDIQLSVAARFGDEAAVRALADKGADLEFVDDIHGLAPLSWAIRGGFEAIVEFLVEKGVDVESRDHGVYGGTQLIWAIMTGNTAAAKLLLEKGADVESRDWRYGWSPLTWAVVDRRRSLVELLLEKGADIESKDQFKGRTPLSWAAERGEAATMKLLLEKGADTESTDQEDGLTPLLWAARARREELFRLLLDQGARLEERKYKGGRTLLWQAVENGWEDIVQILLEMGFDADSKYNFWGLSLREWAAKSRQQLTDSMWALINAGVDVETEDSEEKRNEEPSLKAPEMGHECYVSLHPGYKFLNKWEV
ncbi:hypothetical protein PV08_10913 [Exophiala spinifera]|uniref:Uncharacterized protein n=1 Tax=Exophiala spinifera TaxID=91928 RepID=A0A0D1Y9E5_9EURO|nr:uncharacterized protein PV08_10913 [Exophiala spinifera]KIW11611.1 hypothetical protein PV08_10913 [Exophiala spinifera]